MSEVEIKRRLVTVSFDGVTNQQDLAAVFGLKMKT